MLEGASPSADRPSRLLSSYLDTAAYRTSGAISAGNIGIGLSLLGPYSPQSRKSYEKDTGDGDGDGGGRGYGDGMVVVSMVPLERVSSFIPRRRSGPPIQWDVLMAEPCWN